MIEFLLRGESDAALWLTSLDVFSPPFLRDEDQVKENVVLSLSLSRNEVEMLFDAWKNREAGSNSCSCINSFGPSIVAPQTVSCSRKEE